MKKILLAGAVALFGLSNAQIAKGTTYLSGQVGYSQTENNNTDKKVESYKVLPTVGYFVDTNLAVGLGLGYKNDNTKTVSTIGATTVDAKETVSGFVVAPFVRKYWTVGEKLYIFGQLEVPMVFGQNKDEATSTTTVGGTTATTSTSTKNNFTSIGVNVKPGLDYFLNKNWSIEATIGEFGYNTSKVDVDGAKRVNDYKFGLNLSSVTFGVKYVFAK
ncbi:MULTISPECIES: outer membrane beta-barrel protein [Chryseobacterium]|jgi:outer membrane protein|uniref:Outer membrane protein n=1 Tax=Chryseobacterium rhizosphaerae TaxID=395937 RepID=A0AAE3Y6A6_9FLAO|nr:MULTISPECIES: outer membrane beta-barrel protein [Chryseobacterium]MBL3548984.1 outer membrane beta-barrel protein [Chryseobacterium sp. KMC2]MDC8099918.1 outer membrane beta-barrel protein [Chryseobacterium rhizosphaerae]MDR6524744.1 outer membrane protein [Chryseobacterium rhizosphaerae]MDR6547072.1 outer membrane protein [Chryseobacterium rhizosphaerae]REC70273.1 porin family protein [Chryseobacterium rhizosphaerae]